MEMLYEMARQINGLPQEAWEELDLRLFPLRLVRAMDPRLLTSEQLEVYTEKLALS